MIFFHLPQMGTYKADTGELLQEGEYGEAAIKQPLLQEGEYGEAAVKQLLLQEGNMEKQQ